MEYLHIDHIIDLYIYLLMNHILVQDVLIPKILFFFN